MSFQLYPHQERFIEQLRGQIRAGNRSVLGQAPTGFGKTVVATRIAENVVHGGSRLWFIVHRKELLDQTYRAFYSSGLSPDYIAAGRKMTGEPVTLCSIQTLANRMGSTIWPDVCIWDESHHMPSASYQSVKAALTRSIHIGLTATPERLDGRGLDGFFDSMVLGPPVRQLIDDGFLSDYDVYSTPLQIDTSGIKKIAGDFQKSKLAEAADTPTITGNAVKHYQELCEGKQGIGFCINVEHSKHTAQAFWRAGIRSAHVDAKTPRDERERTMAAFRAGEIQVLFNVDLFGEGVDVPAVEVALLLRPTASLSLYLQQVGRALRRSPGKDKAIILDHAGNVMRHGLPDDDRHWSLHGRAKKQAAEPVLTIKTCPACFHIFRPAPFCPACGHAMVADSAREIIVDEGTNLEKVDKEALQVARKREQSKAKDYESLVELGRARNYKSPERWAMYVLNGRRKSG